MIQNERETLKKALFFAAGTATGFGGMLFFSRQLASRTFRKAFTRLMTDPYTQNLAEVISSSYRINLFNVIENNMRAHHGQIPYRPMGSMRKFRNLESITFDFAQLHCLPTPGDIRVDLSTVIGPQAQKPLGLQNPLIISGMAYGLALTREVKIAEAIGSGKASVALNSGEGPDLPQARKHAYRWIQQYSRGKWTHHPDLFKKSDAVEIQFSQGASGGIGHVMPAKGIDEPLRKAMGLEKGEDAIIHARHREIENLGGLKSLVARLRMQSNGAPVGVKIAAGNSLEKDMALALETGVDFITLDGAQAATKGSPPIIQDDFGIPTLFALCRGIHFLEQQGAKKNVSLIISGGLYTPGDFLKCLALGADAVAIGTTALLAMANGQTDKTLPWEPPTQMVFHNGDFADKFDYKKGARSLENFLKACLLELAEGIRALGKTSLKEVGREDLCALDEETSRATGLPLATIPADLQKF